MSLVDTTTGEIEQVTLEDLEEIIGAGLRTFVDVGEALAKIRDSKLYLEHAETFESYCSERWGLSRPRAYELMHAAEAVSAMADTEPDVPRPTNERQARELAPLKDDPSAMAAAMQAASTATNGHVTAAAIKEAVAEVYPIPKAKHAKDWVAPQESEADRTERERVEGVMRSVKRLQVLCSNWVEITHRGTPEQFVERLNLLDRFDRQRIEEIVAIYERGTADA